MAKKEANFDVYIQEQLRDAKIEFSVQGSTVHEINEALKTASKRQTGKGGYPEFVAIVGEYVLVGENKPDRSLLCQRDSEDNISLEVKATEEYALNGALWYAKRIIEKTSFKKVFAFGNAGDSKHHILQPLFVGVDGHVELDEVQTFENFSADNIEEYYRRIVLGETPPEDVELGEVLKHAKTLHEYLRTFGSLGEDEKPLVVSAILLALREEKEKNFQIDMLNGDTHVTDGSKLFKALESCFARAQVGPQMKRDRILNQFTLIKDRPKLNAKVPTLGDKTPLRYFTEFIRENIFNAVISNSGEDFLGRFYSEFVSYSGGDGQALGVVLTPSHITDLFCDLVDLKPDDVLFDPCCGTGGFLVAGMYRLFEMAQDEHAKNNVKEKQIHGIEDREDMFAIATTNMIFRGDGRSNLECGDFFTYNPSELQISREATVGLMNPPYSQGSKEHPGLYEICFIRHLLDSLVKGGRTAVIVPVSTMIGKSKEEKEVKKELLKRHTLEGVISCNKNTFYGVGTVPCIAIFTCGVSHPKDKLVKFANFEDDGFVVKKHIGLVETERAKDRKSYLLDCWRGKVEDVPSKFMVQTVVEDTDEWIHAFYYYNDEIPTEQDFMDSIADYLTFEFNMITRGRGYLFEEDSRDACVER
ncbi:MAG: SAM-dependent methyltransferase [Oscillospiraceae bacterium]|nr:SAM-dependent methyltransferase [Oscillospiraceae bacterium]